MDQVAKRQQAHEKAETTGAQPLDRPLVVARGETQKPQRVVVVQQRDAVHRHAEVLVQQLAVACACR